MADLIYTAVTSIDGFVNDATGGFDWAAPTEEVHAFVNDLERRTGTYLYGRRLWETMRIWQTLDLADAPAVIEDFATLWRQADKVVFSSTLHGTDVPRTELVDRFDPADIANRKATSDRPISIGGPTLAAEALRAGLVDELRHLVVPHIVGGGTNWLPDDLRLDLTVVARRDFADGSTYTAYRPV